VALKGFINFVTRNKLAVWLLTIIIVFTGIFSGTRMKTEMIPDVSIPFVMVSSTYPGATPEQVMEDVSLPLERTLENLRNVKAVYSNSYENVASLQVEYEYGIDMDEATRELRSALDNVNLPDDAEEPTVSTVSMDMMPVVALSVSSTTEDIVDLTTTVEEMLLPKINKLDGVANVMTDGQHIEEVELVFDEEKLAEFELIEDDVKDIIRASNLSVPLGLYEFEEEEQAIAVDGKFTTVDELKEMLIPVEPSATQPSPFIALEELADIELIGKVESVSRT